MRIALLVAALAGTASAQPAAPRELDQLAETARHIARDGQCAALPTIASHVRALDADYYAHVFVLDPAVAACLGAPPSAHPADPVDRKSSGVAIALSFGTTAAGGLMLLAAGHRSGSDPGEGPIVVAGLAAFAIGPTVGHIYAGRIWSTGLAIRLAGASAGVVGATMVLGCVDRCDHPDQADVGAGLFLAGAAAYGLGMLYEIASADVAARDYNAAHAAVTLAPLRSRDGLIPGLAVAGRW
ncbi:MAG: hypothetical protein ACM31C_07795 [Acidobacteriota bacterium]